MLRWFYIAIVSRYPHTSNTGPCVFFFVFSPFFSFVSLIILMLLRSNRPDNVLLDMTESCPFLGPCLLWWLPRQRLLQLSCSIETTALQGLWSMYLYLYLYLDLHLDLHRTAALLRCISTAHVQIRASPIICQCQAYPLSPPPTPGGDRTFGRTSSVYCVAFPSESC